MSRLQTCYPEIRMEKEKGKMAPIITITEEVVPFFHMSLRKNVVLILETEAIGKLYVALLILPQLKRGVGGDAHTKWLENFFPKINKIIFPFQKESFYFIHTTITYIGIHIIVRDLLYTVYLVGLYRYFLVYDSFGNFTFPA